MQPDPTKIPDSHLVDASDSGWRKYILTFATIGILGWGYWTAQYSPILQGLYVTFGGFILAAAGLYMGANFANKLQGGLINLKAYPLQDPEAPQSSLPEPAKPPVPPTNIVPPTGTENKE